MNNNKGFNWFIPIMIGVILLFIVPGMIGDSGGKTIDENDFYKLVQNGKVEEVMVYRDTYKADVFLNKAAKAELQKQSKSD